MKSNMSQAPELTKVVHHDEAQTRGKTTQCTAALQLISFSQSDSTSLQGGAAAHQPTQFHGSVLPAPYI
jgi:hypothetical protein